MNNEIKLIECPRDAMQGIKKFIPTKLKASYINSLLKVGFNTIDFGSFVSPKAIPQMKDTAALLKLLNLENNKTKLLSIVANIRGAQDACQFDEITYLGYPFSVSETFQLRNTNTTIEQSLNNVEKIQELAIKNKKKLVVYLSMAFGNPYGDQWNEDIVAKWAEKLHKKIDVSILALSDTIGVSNATNIHQLFSTLIPQFKAIEFGAHLHTTPNTWQEKIETAYKSGCRRFDGAIKGFGGCPMAQNKLTGNMPTEKMIAYFKEQNINNNLNDTHFYDSLKKADELFQNYK